MIFLTAYNCMSRQALEEEYQKVLEWVKAFQERLMHVLDLEV
jgi:hypothetical protein